MSGAVTNTPGLGAAQQAVLQVDPAAYPKSEEMAMGYAAAYPLGVIGIILSMFIVRAVFRIKIEDEIKQIDEETANSQLKPHIITLKVTNQLIDGMNLVQLHEVITCNFVVSRLKDAEGNVVIPTSKTILHVGDYLYTVMSAHDEERFKAVVGQEVEMEWETIPSPVINRRIQITKSQFNGEA